MLRILAIFAFSLSTSAATLQVAVTTSLSGIEFSDGCSKSASGSVGPLSLQCHTEFLPTGKDLPVLSHSEASVDYGSMRAAAFGRGNLAQEDPPFNYQNEESVEISFADALVVDRSGSGYIRMFASMEPFSTGIAAIIFTANSIEYSGDPENIDTGLIPVNFSDWVTFSLRLVGSVGSDNGTEWSAGLGSITLYDADGQQISGFNYATESGVAYDLVGGTLAEVPEPSTWMLLAIGLAIIVLKHRKEARTLR